MNDAGNFERSRCAHDRNSNKTSLGKNHVGTDFLQDTSGLYITFHNPERIREILQIKVAAELSRGNPIIGDIIISDQPFLHSFIGTDIGNFIAKLPQRRQEGDIWRNVSGGSAAGKNDSF